MPNDFLPFADAGGANVIDQPTYAAASYVTTGRGSGIMPAAIYNKIARQSSIAAYLLGQIIVDNAGLSALDNGDLATLLASLKLALNRNAPPPTRTVLTSGSALTYTPPANCRRISIRMIGGGGGSGGFNNAGATAGGPGVATVFGSVSANPGLGGGPNSGATSGAGGLGGSAGGGSATLRVPGARGGTGQSGNSPFGGSGAGSYFNGGVPPNTGGTVGVSPAANTGCGASGADSNSASFGPGGGGGAGEYVEFGVNNPGAIVYTVGAGGAAGGNGGSGFAGALGGSGLIIVDEFYS